MTTRGRCPSLSPSSAAPTDLPQQSNAALLARGRQGEVILDAKGVGADTMAVVTAFMVAFSLDQALSGRRSDFESFGIYCAYSIGVGAASLSGIATVLLFTFFSVKLRRLVGRSNFHFGTETDVTVLEEIRGGQENLRRSFAECWISEEIRFYARRWYYDSNRAVNGEALYHWGIMGFRFHLASSTIVLYLRLFDSQPTVIFCSNLALFVMPAVAILLLHKGDAVYDLA